MTTQSGSHRRIRTRLVWSFSLLSLLIIAVFGLFNFLFVYVVEDVFFERLVAEEKQYLIAGYDATGQLPEPRRSFIQIISTIDQLPADMREEYRRAAPTRRVCRCPGQALPPQLQQGTAVHPGCRGE
jgi:hypothetical protein